MLLENFSGTECVNLLSTFFSKQILYFFVFFLGWSSFAKVSNINESFQLHSYHKTLLHVEDFTTQFKWLVKRRSFSLPFKFSWPLGRRRTFEKKKNPWASFLPFTVKKQLFWMGGHFLKTFLIYRFSSSEKIIFFLMSYCYFNIFIFITWHFSFYNVNKESHKLLWLLKMLWKKGNMKMINCRQTSFCWLNLILFEVSKLLQVLNEDWKKGCLFIWFIILRTFLICGMNLSSY